MTYRETEAIFRAINQYPMPDPFMRLVCEVVAASDARSPSTSARSEQVPLADDDLDCAAMIWLILRARGLNFVRPRVHIVDEWNLVLAPETIH